MTGKSKIKYLTLIAILVFLFLPRLTHADPLGIMEYLGTVMKGLDESVGPIIKWEFIIIIFNLISLIVLNFTSILMDHVITASPQWLSVTHSPMVQAGWHFTAGLANLFIVLALIVLAFGFILKIESFQARKTLPRLIIIALLLNFSLVFIGALIDIANILYNTILKIASPSMIANAVSPMVSTLYSIVWEYFTLKYFPLIISKFFPPAAIAALILKAATIFRYLYMPIAFTQILNALLAFSMAIIFFVYTFIFTARVIIVQILAVVSPLIFLCWALPPLKKYWDEWLNHLLQWLFFGLILYFFLVIGLKMANFLMPTSSTGVPIVGLLAIPATLKYYFFLFIYLTIIIFFAQRLTPIFASALISRGAALAGVAAVATLPLIAGAIKEGKYGMTTAMGKQKEIDEKGKKSYEEKAAQLEMNTKKVGSRYQIKNEDEMARDKENAKALRQEAKELVKKRDWSKLDEEQKKEMEKTEGRWYDKLPRNIKAAAGKGYDKYVNAPFGTSFNEEAKDNLAVEYAQAQKIENATDIERSFRNYAKRGMWDFAAVWLKRFLDKNPGTDKSSPTFKKIMAGLGVNEDVRLKMDRSLNALGEVNIKKDLTRGLYTDADDLYEQQGSLPTDTEEGREKKDKIGALWDTLDENSKNQVLGIKKVEELEEKDEEELKAMSPEEKVKYEKNLKAWNKFNKWQSMNENDKKERGLRALDTIGQTDYDEVKTANNEFIEAAMPAAPHLWNIGHHSQGLQYFRNWYVQQLNANTDKIGLAGALGHWGFEGLGAGLSYSGLGVETPAKALEVVLRELWRRKQNLTPEQLKKYNTVVKDIYDSEYTDGRDGKKYSYKALLDQYLQENPDYVNSLAREGEESEDVESAKRTLDNYRTGGAADGGSAEDEEEKIWKGILGKKKETNDGGVGDADKRMNIAGYETYEKIKTETAGSNLNAEDYAKKINELNQKKERLERLSRENAGDQKIIKDIKRETELVDAQISHTIKKQMHRAQVGELTVKIKRELNKSDFETLGEVSKSEDYQKMELEDNFNDINLKMAEAKYANDGEQVNELFTEKKKLAREYVEKTNPDIMEKIKDMENLLKEKREGFKPGTSQRYRKSEDSKRNEIENLNKKLEAETNKILNEEGGRLQEEEAAEVDSSNTAASLTTARRRKENLEKRLANTNPENKEEINALTNLIKSKEEEIKTFEEQMSREKNKKEK